MINNRLNLNTVAIQNYSMVGVFLAFSETDSSVASYTCKIVNFEWVYSIVYAWSVNSFHTYN